MVSGRHRQLFCILYVTLIDINGKPFLPGKEKTSSSVTMLTLKIKIGSEEPIIDLSHSSDLLSNVRICTVVNYKIYHYLRVLSQGHLVLLKIHERQQVSVPSVVSN